jgi:hypothetical protein
MLKNILLLLFLFLQFSNQLIIGQTFGFGCLGFVGGYAGFTYQNYDAAGLNEYIREFNQREYVNTPVDEFSHSYGFRVGLNFFRATFANGILVTAKGYYQYLDKKNKGGVGIGQSTDNYSIDLDSRNYSLGFDVGWQFTKLISWKIIDGSLNFNNITLTETTALAGSPTEVKKYKSDTSVLGYSIGTGIIVAIIQDYVSIEGLAGYTFLVIDNVYLDDGTKFINSEQTTSQAKFINSGGFTAVVQLNVGFPLL